MDWHVFDLSFNRLGVIRSYDTVTIEHAYLAHDVLEFELVAKQDVDEFTTDDNYYEVRQQIIELFFSETARNEGRIICKSSDLSHGYLIRTVQYLDEIDSDKKPEKLKLTAYGLTYLIRSRSIAQQQVFNGDIEMAIRYFVQTNCITPINPNRVISNLILGDLSGIEINVDAAFVEQSLDEALYELCTPHNVSFNVVMDHAIQKYVFVVVKGADRSDLQDIHEPVILSKKFGNVSRESFIDDRSAEKTTAVTKGYYEEAIEAYDMYVYSGDENTGLNRWEVFVDASGIESIYTGADDVDYSMTEQQYQDTLRAKGDEILVEYKRKQSFESDIANDTDYIFGVDYFVGDIIAAQNDELGVTMRQRVMQATEVYTPTGYELTHAFGDAILSFTDVIKRELKRK